MRWLKRLGVALAVFAVGFCGCTALRGPVSLPFDLVTNLGATIEAPELRPPADSRRRVVFLQHGMWRTERSMDRLERTLEANGYEVQNLGYPSTEERIEAHAARLGEAVEARFREGPVDELSFVGHSMGGLVIEEYLRRADARAPKACVYLGSPHRGAVLADKRHHWFAFQVAMGDQAASQLVTTAPLHRRPIPYGERSGAVVGDIGEGNRAIPGRDDGTVGVEEATFEGCSDTVVLPVGHSFITVAPGALRQVLAFLRDGRFAPVAD
jgi:pimeloyl-ACP methyl ester carboxylesterase